MTIVSMDRVYGSRNNSTLLKLEAIATEARTVLPNITAVDVADVLLDGDIAQAIVSTETIGALAGYVIEKIGYPVRLTTETQVSPEVLDYLKSMAELEIKLREELELAATYERYDLAIIAAHHHEALVEELALRDPEYWA